MESRRLILTDDGSSSVYDQALKETFHSTHGAIQESRHVFIDSGLRQITSDPINILEIGFGTGLNALLSLEYASDQHISINYSTIEAFPLPNEIIKELNYPELTGGGKGKSWFSKLHALDWNRPEALNSHFKIEKLHTNWLVHKLDQEYFDIVFYDAFAPSKQPEMWEYDLIKKACDSLKTGGIFVTYSARGQLKRDLRSAGMTVESIPGPPGKKEMVRAIKT